MNIRAICFLAFCLFVVMLLAGCAPENQPIVPETGGKTAFIPAQIELARNTVLDYVVSASPLTALPASTRWQPEAGTQSNGEYHFISGDWHMTVLPANSSSENQQVVITNRTRNTFWCGYIKPDGAVVDTTLTR